MATALLLDPIYKQHIPGPGHPERPERYDAITAALEREGLVKSLERIGVRPATDDEIAMCHPRDYIAVVKRDFARGAHDLSTGDTAIGPKSLDVALRAAGGVLNAVDAVMDGRVKNAFCAVRPPGHHAGRSHAMGFCFFNNVAIAARHALERHGLQRVAVVDFDVHHGNGTEDILAGDERVLMVGIFQKGLYPFSGETPRGPNMVNLPLAAYTRGPAVRELIEQVWLPRLDAFRPEMLFVSAGFDAHRDDDLGQLGLVESDYAWITATLCEVAKRHARGRIVSCLEGGYNLDALARSVEAHVRALAEL
jgi:acetoin utilization deacetylase AcuC-like enzyme